MPMTVAQITAETIINSLANAFGGMSQLPDEVVGQAIFGRRNNAGLDIAEEVIEAAAVAIFSYWVENNADLDVIRGAVRDGYKAAEARIASHS